MKANQRKSRFLRFAVRALLALGAVSATGAATAANISWSAPKALSRGVTLRQAKVTAPREIRYLAVRVDLKTPGLYLVGTDRDPDYGKPLEENPGLYAKQSDGTQKRIEPTVIRTRREPVRDFMTRAVLDVKSGGRGLDMALAFTSATTCYPYDRRHANPNGLIVSEGKVVTERGSVKPLLVVRKNGTAAIVDTLAPAEYPGVQVANTGAMLIRRDGQDLVPQNRDRLCARTAVGVTRDGRYLWILEADDGKTLFDRTGANYHDLNDAFASLGVTDAISTGRGGECAIVARDQKSGVIQTLNVCAEGREPSRCVAAIGVCYRAGATASAASEPEKPPVPPPGPEQIAGRITQGRLSMSRDKSAGEATLRGQVRVSANSDLARFKRPVLYVAALFDVDGMWRMYDVVCTDPKSCWGHCLDHEQTPAQVSKWQPEVGKDSCATLIFGDVKRGLFIGYRVPLDRAKLLGYRLELWQNGGLVDSYDSDRPTLRRIGVPDDWSEKGKYSGKIVYRWPPKD